MTITSMMEIDAIWGTKTPYQKWAEAEKIDLLGGYAIQNLHTIELKPWERLGGRGILVQLIGTGGFNDAWVCEIAPGSQLKPLRHLFESLVFVVSGRGATSIWTEGGPKQTFEWQTGSLFAIPLNTSYQHFNGSGEQPARLMFCTTSPLMMNLIHNDDFIWNNPFAFADRYQPDPEYFSGKGTLYPGRVWDTNFIPDVRTFQLREWKERGAGGRNMRFEIAGNSMVAHVSEFPVGTYKKGHRHGPGAHVVILNGKGYTLMWQMGQTPDQGVRIDWQEGSVVVPPAEWYHQHFNSGGEISRYLAIRWGSRKFRFGEEWDKTDMSEKEGGRQIEYPDEHPYILETFKRECGAQGVEVKMDAYFAPAR